jgi:hypothetical protein
MQVPASLQNCALAQGGRSCVQRVSGVHTGEPQTPRLGWHVNSFCVPSGQQMQGRFLRVLQFRLDSHARPTLHRRGRSTSAPATDVSAGAT